MFAGFTTDLFGLMIHFSSEGGEVNYNLKFSFKRLFNKIPVKLDPDWPSVGTSWRVFAFIKFLKQSFYFPWIKFLVSPYRIVKTSFNAWGIQKIRPWNFPLRRKQLCSSVCSFHRTLKGIRSGFFRGLRADLSESFHRLTRRLYRYFLSGKQ